MDDVREAKAKLVEMLADHEGKFAVGIGRDGVEVRLYDESIRDFFPEEIDGVKVNVVVTEFPKAR